MRSIAHFLQRHRIVALVFVLMLVSPSAAQDDAAPWQDVITEQIEAFRSGDAAAALNLAGAVFKQSFPSAEVFYEAIMGMGYTPIRDSSSHSFGAFEAGPAVALQQVTLVGIDQQIYEAVYQMVLEPEGWRIAGCQMVQSAALAV